MFLASVISVFSPGDLAGDGMVLLVSYLGHCDGVIAVGDVTPRGAATVGGVVSFPSAVFLCSCHVVVFWVSCRRQDFKCSIDLLSMTF